MRARLALDPDDTSTHRTMRRGLAILRAFRPGLGVLTNGDLSERTGLARSTVSRLTAALVESGLLRQLPNAGGYAPSAACVSLGFAALQSLAEPRQRVLARMQEAADDENVSISLAIPDGDEMVYIDTFRKALREKLLHVQPGFRLPMESTALGRAALAATPAEQRDACIVRLAARSKSGAELVAQIRAAVAHHAQHGWVQASWQPGIVSVARAVQWGDYPVFAFNCTGTPSSMTAGKIQRRLVPLLMELTSLAVGPVPQPPRRRRAQAG